MGEPKSTIQTVDAEDVAQRIDEILDAIDRAAIRMSGEKGGEPIAAIVPAGDVVRLRQLDAHLAERLRFLGAMRAPFRGVPAEEIERETERIMAEIGAEDRRAKAAAGDR